MLEAVYGKTTKLNNRQQRFRRINMTGQCCEVVVRLLGDCFETAGRVKEFRGSSEM